MSREDKVVIKFGPAKLDSPKTIKRALENVTPETGPATDFNPDDYVPIDQLPDLVNDIIDEYVPVEGGSELVIGMPPGTPYVYFKPTLVKFPIPVHDTQRVQFDNLSGVFTIGRNWFLIEDNDNIAGFGAGAIVGTYRQSTNFKLVGYSLSDGTAPSVTMPIIARGLHKVTSTFGVLDPSSSSFTQVHVCEGGLFTSFTPAVPATSYTMRAVGADETGTYIIAVWGQTSNATIYIRTYTKTGSLVDTQTLVMPTTMTNTDSTLIENGWMIINGYYPKRANTTSALGPTITWSPTGLPTRSAMAISPDGYGFFWRVGTPSSISRVNLTNGASVQIITPYNNLEGTLIYGMQPLSATRVLLGGKISVADELSNIYYIPLYVDAIITADGVTYGEETFTTEPTWNLTTPDALTNNETGCARPLRTSASTSVVMAIAGEAYGVNGYGFIFEQTLT